MVDELLRGKSGQLFVTMSLGAIFAQNGRLILSPLLPTLISDLSITPSKAGVALTVMWGLAALCQFIGGRFADIYSRKTVIVGGLALNVVGLLLLSTTNSYPVFVGGVAIVGASVGLFITAAYVGSADLFVDARGKAFGVLGASLDVGAAVAVVLASIALSLFIWQAAFVPIIIGQCLVLVMYHVLSDEAYEVRKPSLDVGGTIGRLLEAARVRWTLLALALFTFTYQGVVNFLPTYLQLEKGETALFANSVLLGFFIVGMVARPIGGWLGDRFGHNNVAMGLPMLTAAGLITIIIGISQPVIVLGVVLFGVGLSPFFPLMQTVMMETFSNASMGGDFGGARTLFVGLGSLGSMYVGFTAEHVGFGGAFGSLVLVMAVAFVVTVFVKSLPDERGSTRIGA